MSDSKTRKGTSYFPIIEQPAKLRLYLNDPEILEHLNQKKLPLPIKIKGTLLIAMGEDMKLHIIFLHKTARNGFMPVFFDLEGMELKFTLGLASLRPIKATKGET